MGMLSEYEYEDEFFSSEPDEELDDVDDFDEDEDEDEDDGA